MFSIAGDLSLTRNLSTKTLSTGIIDPQGSVVATSYTHTPEVENGQVAAPVTMWSALESFDEYGNTLAVSQDKSTGALNYSWLGGKERATDLSGLVLMGVRLYNSVTGQFTSVDPVKGGNTTAYAYPQDPINQFDLDGKWRQWVKKKAARAWGGIKAGGRWAHRNRGTVAGWAQTGLCIVGGLATCAVAGAIAWGVRARQRGLTRKNLRANVADAAMSFVGVAAIRAPIPFARYGTKYMWRAGQSTSKLFSRARAREVVVNQGWNSPNTIYSYGAGKARKRL